MVEKAPERKPNQKTPKYKYEPGMHSPTTINKDKEIVFPKKYPKNPEFQH